LYYSDELHAANKEEKPKVAYTPKELEMAKALVKNLAAPFKPAQFHDAYRDRVEELIAQKKKGGKISLPSQRPKAPVIDLMDALRRSLKSTSRGAARAPGTPERDSPSAGKKTGARRKAAA
jgi:DNA end-binding protein Ku